MSIAAVISFVIPLLCANAVPAAKPEEPVIAYNLYFGDLHTHTGYSDAYEDSTPWDAYAAATAAGADFMAVTDHISIWHAYEAFTMTPEQWEDSLAAAEYYTSKDFVAMASYEAWLLANVGEINVYNTKELPPAKTLGYRQDRLPVFMDWLAKTGALGQFNHPLYVSENFMDFAHYSASRDIAMAAVEVYNDEFTEDSYILALDKGWHLLPSVNSDTHYSDWIAGHETRTVLLAPSLTPENLYDAMRNHRGYGTLDSNLRISYNLNGAVMGSVLASTVTSYSAVIHVEDPDGVASDAITLLELVSDAGVVVASMPGDGTTVDWTVSLSSQSSHYYYLRVTTASGVDGLPGITAWTAPVWTGR